MARAPKFGRTFSRRPAFSFRPRTRFKLPKRSAPLFSKTPGTPTRTIASGTWLSVVLSVLVHVLLLFTFVLAIRLLIKIPPPPPLPLIVPQSFLSGNQLSHPDKVTAAPTRASALKRFLSTRNASNSVSPTALNAMLNGTATNEHLYAISLGKGGELASNNGSMGAMGVPGKTIGGMPAVSFFGVQTRAKRVVFLVDHGGRMVGHLYLLRREVQRSIRHLLPFQRFAVIKISATYKILGPDKLLRASPANRAKVLPLVHNIIAENKDMGQLQPFLRPFKAAWAMHPQVIFFLTDGYVDPRLIADIGDLNSQYPIRVYTFTFMGDNQRHQKNLRKIAAETGGKFLYLSKRILEREGSSATP